ncbi:Ld135-like protein [Clanis bilineata nucleopolyhedrovirus]|uniref:Ld135-like protein n=1 Tax=Clanis bilineata nucleopolyhedrovirus TaxID=1307957 RepID=Q0N3Z0_9ABAC|nr:Ld135-like protein [Clanis bilineata nucleopolyhedrovirus]ABF47453.1 Ld135-like protein [Clanis bilineata nucleopolyhedrovirus]
MKNKSKLNLRINYLNYFQNIKYLVGFVHGFINNKDQYTNQDYIKFSKTVVQLLNDIIDDLVTNDFSLTIGSAASSSIRSPIPATQTSAVEYLTRARDEIIKSMERIGDEKEHQHHGRNTLIFKDLTAYVENHMNLLPPVKEK